jgi:hypothetical protein
MAERLIKCEKNDFFNAWNESGLNGLETVGLQIEVKNLDNTISSFYDFASCIEI